MNTAITYEACCRHDDAHGSLVLPDHDLVLHRSNLHPVKHLVPPHINLFI